MSYSFVDVDRFVEAGCALEKRSIDGEDAQAEWALLTDARWTGGFPFRMLVKEVDGWDHLRIGLLMGHDPRVAQFCFYARGRGITEDALGSELESICLDLGIQRLVGPIEPFSWRRTGFAATCAPAKAFPGERDTIAHYHSDFTRAGFTSAETFESRVAHRIDSVIKLGFMLRSGRSVGVGAFEAYKGKDAIRLLPELHALTMPGVAMSPFRSFDERLFRRTFTTLFNSSDQAVLNTVEVNKERVGFCVSYAADQWSEHPDKRTAVLRTLGVDPRYRGKGLGYAISGLAHDQWLDAGYTQMIYPFMPCKGSAHAMASLFSSRFRLYSTLEKRFRKPGFTISSDVRIQIIGGEPVADAVMR